MPLLVESRKDPSKPQSSQVLAIHLIRILGAPEEDEEDNDFQENNVVDVHANE